MIILTLRTDNPKAEVGLYDNSNQLVYETWEAHRQLAETLHNKIETLLKMVNKDWAEIDGIVVYSGPGSFTGLRIGISAMNALAYTNGIPIIGASSEDWVEKGIALLNESKGQKQVLPEYGSEAHITQPKK